MQESPRFTSCSSPGAFDTLFPYSAIVGGILLFLRSLRGEDCALRYRHPTILPALAIWWVWITNTPSEVEGVFRVELNQHWERLVPGQRADQLAEAPPDHPQPEEPRRPEEERRSAS